MRDESEKEVVHRLEAFSDIVIGFSLAQLALSLTIPRHSIDLFTSRQGASGLIALVVTFALVCSVWWSHHRLFRYVFVPAPVNILANFAALGGVIFLAYSMQVLLHAGLIDRIAYAMYTGSYAWILLLFAFMAWNSVRLRDGELTGAKRERALRFAWRTSIAGTWLAAVAVVGVSLGPQAPINQWLLPLLVLAFLLHRIATRRSAPATS